MDGTLSFSFWTQDPRTRLTLTSCLLDTLHGSSFHLRAENTTSTLLTCFMNSKESALAISSTLLKSPSLGNDERRAPSQVSLLLWLDFPPMKRIVNVMFLCKLIACFKLSTFLFPLLNDPNTRNTGGLRWSTNESPTMAGGKKVGTTKLLCLGVKKKMLVVFSSLGSSSWQMMIKLRCKCEKTTIVEQN